MRILSQQVLQQVHLVCRSGWASRFQPQHPPFLNLPLNLNRSRVITLVVELFTAAPDTQDLVNRLHSSQEESTGVIAKTAAKINDILTPVKLTNRVSVLETLQN